MKPWQRQHRTEVRDRKPARTREVRQQLLSGQPVGAVPLCLDLDLVGRLAHEQRREEVHLVRVLVERGELGPQHAQGPSRVPLLQELEELLLPEPEAHQVAVRAGG